MPPVDTPTPAPSSPVGPSSWRDAPPAVAHAYLVAQEARLNAALAQAASPRASALRLGGPTVGRLTQAAAGRSGMGLPNPEVQALVVRALDGAFDADARVAGPAGGERLVADMMLKGALGRCRGETVTSLTFLSRHPKLNGAQADPSALVQDPALQRHAQNVVGALHQLRQAGDVLRASNDPEVRARARRADDALDQLQTHPRWGAVVRLVTQTVTPPVEPSAEPSPGARRGPAR